MEVEEPLNLIKNKVRSFSRKVVTGSEEKSLRDHLKRELKKPMRVKLKDKISFTLGLLNVLATEYFLLRMLHAVDGKPIGTKYFTCADTPKYFVYWYLLWVFPLIGLRWMMYKSENMHFFLFDFCYFANLICVLSSAVLPGNLVFHSLDKVTTVFIHAFPPMLTWAERWYGRFRDEAGVCSSSRSLLQGWFDFSAFSAEDSPDHPPCTLDYATGFFFPLLAYILWQVGYLVKTELVDGAKLKNDPSIMTSSRWFIKARSGALYHLVLKLARRAGMLGPQEHFDPESVSGKAVFVGSQFVYTVLCMSPVVLMYHSWWLHSIVLLAVLTNCVWNGAGYYFEVFSLKYQAHLQKIINESRERVESVDSTGTAESADGGASVSLDESADLTDSPARKKAQ